VYCARCNKPLKDDEADPIDMAAPTGPGVKIFVCKTHCKPVPTQTSPVSTRR
jgi:hypothetical protein